MLILMMIQPRHLTGGARSALEVTLSMASPAFGDPRLASVRLIATRAYEEAAGPAAPTTAS